MKLVTTLTAGAILFAGAAVAQDTEAFSPETNAMVVSAFFNDFPVTETNVEALTTQRLAAMRAAYDVELSDTDQRIILANR